MFVAECVKIMTFHSPLKWSGYVVQKTFPLDSILTVQFDTRSVITPFLPTNHFLTIFLPS